MSETRPRNPAPWSCATVLLVAFGMACGGGHAADTDTAHVGDEDPAENPAAADTDAGRGDHGDMAVGELQRYPLRGIVLAVDPTKPGLIVRHEDIEGFMGGMTMNFTVKDVAVLDHFEGNEVIEAMLVFDGENGWLEDIEIVEPRAGDEQE